MTTTRSCTVITTQIRQGARTALGISYDSIDSATLTLGCPQALRSSIDQAIRQWWDGLTKFQRSALSERGLNLKISASFQDQKTQLEGQLSLALE